MDIGFNPSQMNPGAAGFSVPPVQVPGMQPGFDPGKGGKVGAFGDALTQSMQPLSRAGDGSDSRVGSLIGDFIKQVDAKQDAAAEVRKAFLAGESGNLHQTMIASQEASVAFSLMVEMRNKVMEGYQELMRLQI